MSDQTSLILDSNGVVIGTVIGAPGSVPPADGRTVVAREGAVANAGIGWMRQADGSFLDPRAPKPPTKADLKAHAAVRRIAIEEGGVTLPNGVAVKTDRESQGLVDRAVSLAKEDPDAPIDFKASTGWVTLDAATMLMIGIAVGRHVRGSFTLERAADAAIEAGTAVTLADVDAILAGA